MNRRRRSRVATTVNEALQGDGLELKADLNDDNEIVAFDLYDIGIAGGGGRGKIGRLSKTFAHELARMSPRKMAAALHLNDAPVSYAQRAAMGRRGRRRESL